MDRNETASKSDPRQSIRALLAEGRLDEATTGLREDLAAEESSELWNDFAVVQLAQAERALHNALKLDPWNADAPAHMGILLFSLGKRLVFARSARIRRRPHSRSPRNPAQHLCAARSPARKNAHLTTTETNETSQPAAAQRETIVEGDVDLIVHDAFFPDPAYHGFMIEVGAAKPDYLSVSAAFRELAWHVISIEPNPYFCDLHRQRGHEILDCACGPADQDDAPFFLVHTDAKYKGQQVTNESFSSLGVRGKYAEMMRSVPTTVSEIKVKVRRLDTLLWENAPDAKEIDILCIDVEGWELEVLAGLSFSRHQPKVLIVENLFLEPACVESLTAKGYTLWKRLEPNDVFVRNDILYRRT